MLPEQKTQLYDVIHITSRMMVHDNQNHECDQMSGYDKSLGIVCSEVQLDYKLKTRIVNAWV